MRVDNNFNLIRLLAACQVLVIHSFNHLGYEGLLVNFFKVVPGVPVFFFVSGMLITASYERLISYNNGLCKFIINRVLRIYPALWLCVLLSLLAVWLTGYFETQFFSITQIISWVAGQLTFFQFYNPDFMRGFGVGVLNGALWTIAVELQFYVLTPILFWLMMKRRFWFMVVLLVSMAINVWLRLAYDWSDIRIKLLSVSFLPWLYMFMSGALAYAYRSFLSAWLRDMGSLGWIAILTIYLVSMVFIGNYTDNATNAIHPLAFLLLSAIVLRLSSVNLCIPKRAAGFIQSNDYSYGIYIYHTPVLNVTLYVGFCHVQPNMQLAWVILVPVLLAVLSWHIVEKRALALKGKI